MKKPPQAMLSAVDFRNRVWPCDDTVAVARGVRHHTDVAAPDALQIEVSKIAKLLLEHRELPEVAELLTYRQDWAPPKPSRWGRDLNDDDEQYRRELTIFIPVARYASLDDQLQNDLYGPLFSALREATKGRDLIVQHITFAIASEDNTAKPERIEVEVVRSEPLRLPERNDD
jgi:hypothetical protein